MTEDPVRLLSQEDDAFTRSLLRSAKEGDRDDARAHKALVLGAAGGAAAGTAALATAARVSSKGFFASSIGKWIFAGLVLVTGVGSAALVWPRGPAANEAPVAPQPAAQAKPLALSDPSDAPRDKEEPVIAAGSPEPTPAPSVSPNPGAPRASSVSMGPQAAPNPDARASSGAPVTPADAARTAPRTDRDPSGKQASAGLSTATAAAPLTAPAPGLAEEVAALKAAREALAKGQAARCLDAVNAYFAAFPAGHLSAEARYLRVEATLASGRGDEAKTLARSMLASNPKSPYAARLRTIAGEEPAP